VSCRSCRKSIGRQRPADVLSYFDRPGTSNGPTEAINGRLEHLRGSALGFRNLTNYIARSLLEPAASGRNYTLDWDEPENLPPPAPASRHAAAADARPGEEDEGQSFAPGLEALVAEVRQIRPEWSSRSVRRALAHPDVTERGWDRARRAMLAVAADPESKQPGRLAHGGPWWVQPGPSGSSRLRPPWCGGCSDERAHQIDLPDGTISRCPACHPLAREAS
jgi:Transposase